MLTLVEKKKLKNVDSNCMWLDQIITDSSERSLQSSSFIVISSVKVRKRFKWKFSLSFELQAVLYRSFYDGEIMWQVFLSISKQTVLCNYIMKQEIRLKIVLGDKNKFHGVHRKGGFVLLHNEEVVVRQSSSYI